MADYTLLCKYAIGTLENFKALPQIQSIKNIPVYTRENDKSVVVDFDVWISEIYRLFFRRYHNWEIAYDNVDDFLDTLAERIEVHVPNFYLRKDFYNKLLTLSETELRQRGYDVGNYVEHTDTEVDDPFDVLSQITNQNSSTSFSDKGNTYRNQIATLQYTLQEDFLRKFKSLFLQLHSLTNYYG